MTFTESRAIRDAVRDRIARTVAVLGLVTFALIHLLDLPGTINSTPYIGWLYHDGRWSNGARSAAIEGCLGSACSTGS